MMMTHALQQHLNKTGERKGCRAYIREERAACTWASETDECLCISAMFCALVHIQVTIVRLILSASSAGPVPDRQEGKRLELLLSFL